MKLLFLLLPVVMLAGTGYAQNAELCQGAYFTEAGGKAFLDQHPVTTRIAWETRSNQIRNPMLLISDGDDWTKNMPDVEFLYIRNVYVLYRKQDRIENVHLPAEKHDYGPSKRKAMYAFLGKHLKLDLRAVTDKNGEIDESLSEVLEQKDLQVFDDAHPRPANAIMGDNAVLGIL